MYPIVKIIYGFPLHNNQIDYVHSAAINNALEDELPGFMTFYSGAGYMPCAFGIFLDEFDGAHHHVDLSSMNLKPSEQQIFDFVKLVQNLDEPTCTELVKYGYPRIFFLWTTS
jgi:hypothetical protein